MALKHKLDPAEWAARKAAKAAIKAAANPTAKDIAVALGLKSGK